MFTDTDHYYEADDPLTEVFQISDPLVSSIKNRSTKECYLTMSPNQAHCFTVLEHVKRARAEVAAGLLEVGGITDPDQIAGLRLQQILVKGTQMPADEIWAGIFLELTNNCRERGAVQIFTEVGRDTMIVTDNVVYPEESLQRRMMHINALTLWFRKALQNTSPYQDLEGARRSEKPDIPFTVDRVTEMVPSGGQGISHCAGLAAKTGGVLFYVAIGCDSGFSGYDPRAAIRTMRQVNPNDFEFRSTQGRRYSVTDTTGLPMFPVNGPGRIAAVISWNNELLHNLPER